MSKRRPPGGIHRGHRPLYNGLTREKRQVLGGKVSLAETLDSDRRTAEDCARLLALVRVVILHRIDPRRGGPYLRAQRKLYLVDPLLAYLPRHLRQSDASPKMTALAENAVVMALFHDSPSEGSTAGGDSITTGAIADP